MIKGLLLKSSSKFIEPESNSSEKGNLKQRAYLNSLSSLIDYCGVQLTGFVVSPVIVNGLGTSLYGIWQMLGQMSGYSNFADVRATQVLKWTVAKKHVTENEEELRSDVSSAFLVTALFLPLVLVAGGVISWYAPSIIKADPSHYNLIRITSSLLIFALSISKFFDLFEAVLRGMNLGYKRMGLRASIVIGGGILKVISIQYGFGLIGLSVVQLIVALVTGLSYYFVVKKNISWFGWGKTNLKKFFQFGKLSGWYMASTASGTLLSSSDKILLGFIAGPILVSNYALTMFLPLAVQGVVTRIIIGAVPGIGKLFGLNEHYKITNIWLLMNNLIALALAAAGVTILLFNQSFLTLWVGKGHYAGEVANLTILVMVVQDTFIKHDAIIISATLDIKKKVIITILASIAFAGLGLLLIEELGIVGLCLSLIIGKFILFIGQRRILNNKLQNNLPAISISTLRPLILMLIMYISSFYLSTIIQPLSFILLLVLAPLSCIASVCVFYTLGLNHQQRRDIITTAKNIKFFRFS